jgi:hypothetical protein
MAHFMPPQSTLTLSALLATFLAFPLSNGSQPTRILAAASAVIAAERQLLVMACRVIVFRRT